MTDSEGRYTLKGLNPGLYALKAKDYESGTFLDQWYDNLQHPVKGWDPLSPSMYIPFLTAISKSDLIGFTNHHCEFLIKNAFTFCLTLDVLTTSGKQIKIKFYYSNDTSEKDLLCISDTILVQLSHASDNSYMSTWMRYDYNINEMLEEYFSTQLDRVVGLTFKDRVLSRFMRKYTLRIFSI